MPSNRAPSRASSSLVSRHRNKYKPRVMSPNDSSTWQSSRRSTYNQQERRQRASVDEIRYGTPRLRFLGSWKCLSEGPPSPAQIYCTTSADRR
eukprot:3467317-Pleurochrysis_carterae.AAC.1